MCPRPHYRTGFDQRQQRAAIIGQRIDCSQLGRSLVVATLFLDPAFGEPASAQSAPRPYQTIEIAPGLYSFGDGLAFNAFMVTDEGVIVMDSFDKDFAQASLAAIREVTDLPIRLRARDVRA